MTQMETNLGRSQGRKIEDYVKYANAEFSNRYKTAKSVRGRIYYVFPDNTAGIISYSTDKKTLWIEYADSVKDAKKDCFPWEGDGFPIDELGPKEIIRKMIEEVEE